MLRNKHHIYGDNEESLLVPADINYGKHMLYKFVTFKEITAIIDAAKGQSLTYADLAQLAVDIALSLTHIGVGKGDTVGFCSEERIEFMATVIGTICTGATFTTIDVTGKATISHRTQMVKPKVMFCSSESYKALRDTLTIVGSVEKFILYDNEEQEGAILFKDFLTETADVNDFMAAPVNGCVDHAVILYSSGTTGLPKCVPRTHLNLLAHMLTKVDVGYYPGRIVFTANEFYMFGLTCLHAGVTTVFCKRDRVQGVLEAIQKYRVQILQQMPSTLFEIVYSPLLDQYDISSVERILTAGASLRADLLYTVRKRFPNLRDICQIYGATELGVACSDQRAPKGTKENSVGCPRAGIIIKVVDLNTRETLEANKRGEICIKSPTLFPGYLGDSTLSHLDEEGFFKTGDVGYYDEDKYFFITDRIKDLITYHGNQVSPMELEMVLVQHPLVREAGVVGAPDEQYYELPTAFVVLQPEANITTEELTAYVNNQVASWMPLAGGVRWVSQLPRGRRGKLDRKALRQML